MRGVCPERRALEGLTDEDLPAGGPDDGSQMFGNVGQLDIAAVRVIIQVILISPSG